MELNLKSNIKIRLNELLLSTSIHGIPNIIRSTRLPNKILWISSTLTSLGFCGFFVILSILNYYKYEVTTKIRFVNQHNLEMPTITVCNINFFTSQYAADYIINKPDFKKSVPDNYFIEFYYRYGIISNSNNKLWGDSKKKLIWKVEFLNINLKDADFSYFYHPEHGNCYKINSGYDENGTQIPLQYTLIPGKLQGLIIYLNTSFHERLRKYNFNTGAIIFIHNKSESPLSVDGVVLKPGTVTNVALQREFTIQKPKPYSDCDGNTNKIENYDSDIYKMTIQKNGQYYQKICMEQCYQNELAILCNCTDPIFESYVEKPFCAYNDNCLAKVYHSIFNVTNTYCFRKCPLECEKMNFFKTISSYQFGNDKWNDYFKEYYNLNASDIAMVNVYYETLGYTEITENESIDIVLLVSNIGGTAGLFLGISFLSFIEFIELMSDLFLTLLERKMRKTNIFQNSSKK